MPPSRLAFLAFASFALLSACAAPPPEQQEGPAKVAPAAPPPDSGEAVPAAPPVPEVSAEAVRETASALTRFGIRLYQAHATAARGNLAVSPASVSAAFALAYPGARNKTARVMEEVFGFDAPASDILAAHAVVLARGAEGCSVEAAAGAFPDEGLRVEPEYLEMISGSGSAEVVPVRFANASVARETINRWVSSKTHEMLPALIPEPGMDRLSRLVLASAVYFKGTWRDRFEPHGTRDDVFRAATGTRTVPFMSRVGEYRFASLPTAEVVELPYRCGNWSMLFLLPWDGASAVRSGRGGGTGLGLQGLGVRRELRHGTPSKPAANQAPNKPAMSPAQALAKLERQLSFELFAEIDRKLQPRPLLVRVPRFDLTATTPLAKLLREALGAGPLFERSADFSGITTEKPFHVTDAFHAARVRVDEQGTEAAAGTAIVLGSRGSGGPAPRFVLDRPFLFAIRDTTNGAILFLGRVADPGLRSP